MSNFCMNWIVYSQQLKITNLFLRTWGGKNPKQHLPKGIQIVNFTIFHVAWNTLQNKSLHWFLTPIECQLLVNTTSLSSSMSTLCLQLVLLPCGIPPKTNNEVKPSFLIFGLLKSRIWKTRDKKVSEWISNTFKGRKWWERSDNGLNQLEPPALCVWV